jgi:omega-amidase
MSTLTITGIQADLFWQDKQANLEQFAEKIAAIPEKTQVVVLPEMFSTGFSMEAEKLAEEMDGPTLLWMKKTAAARKIILTGSVIIREGSGFFNRLIWMLPTGDYGYYDKRHLFAYGGEHRSYQPGKRRLIGSVNGWKILLLVCYDLRFPVWSRQSSPKQAPDQPKEELEFDLIIYVANWPEKRNHAWKTLLVARAIENQCYVMGVNRVGEDGNKVAHSGDSVIVDPLGKILYQSPSQTDVFTCSLEKKELEVIRQKFPFWKDSDHFEIDL